MGYPTVFPTGTTIYYPDQCHNGYTVFSGGMSGHPYLIDMNGNVVHEWQGMTGFPAKILPGGFVMGSTGLRNPKYGYQDKLDLIQVDWNGNVVWKFDRYERIKDPYQKKARWMARQHHDYQRPGNPVGYYAPGLVPGLSEVNTLILCHKNVTNPAISEK
ncbi:MAG: thioredoxin, partial [bacterium]|nr:thioredoxin [bacterium]